MSRRVGSAAATRSWVTLPIWGFGAAERGRPGCVAASDDAELIPEAPWCSASTPKVSSTGSVSWRRLLPIQMGTRTASPYRRPVGPARRRAAGRSGRPVVCELHGV